MKRVFTQTFGVVGGILERNGKILLIKENQKKGPDDGKWNHPAGWIDVGENPIDAVKREVKEESGYDFEPIHLLGIYSLIREDLVEFLGHLPHAIKFIFIGKISEEPTGELAEDSVETKWFTPEEIYAMGPETLRDGDIKQIVKDYFDEKRYPLEVLTHSYLKK